MSRLTEDKVHSFNVYEDGEVLVGIMDEIDLPGFEFLSDTISGHGIAGEIEDPTVGLTKSMEWEPKFRTLYKNMSLNPLKSKTYTVRAAQQGRDAEGNVGFSGVKAIIKGKPKSFSAGKLKKGSPAEPSSKIEVTYYKLEVNGECLVEIDKFNGVCKINGEDVLAEAKQYC